MSRQRHGRFLPAAAALAAALLIGEAAVGVAAAQRRKPRGKAPAPVDFDVKLPVLGTRLLALPPGPGKALADQACLSCHSASMIAQQRMTEKQWTASLDKMIRWGTVLPAERKDELIAYLVANFGPDNDRFEPVVTRPVGR